MEKKIETLGPFEGIHWLVLVYVYIYIYIYWGLFRDNGKENGNYNIIMGYILGLYRDNERNGHYHLGLRVWV